MNEDSLFAGALERVSPDERAAYLDSACAGNLALRARVEALLAVHIKPDSLLDEPLVPKLATTIDRPTDFEQPGTQIGRYKLLQEIGEGGFGVVYMAEQVEPVTRRVALKIIKPGMDTRAVTARFEAERQTLAMMDHPNIARVFDAGTTERGRPYFVMELVRGIRITQFCDDQQLTPKERLELFIPVCHAIQHAHQKGIIHRDIKPSNVLVSLYDGRPVPKVIDFGVAKAIGERLTEKTMFTQFGQIMGTLEYMSPEQAEMNQLDIDTRGDVYSLGAVLYELLTGTPPLERKRLRTAAFDEVLRIIREEEPPRPSLRLSSGEKLATISAQRKTEPARLSRLVHGELDWIVMKALDKQRARRYETASGLARDIERYLADEPVEARAPSAGYKMRKFLRRNKGPVLAAAAMVSLLVAGSVISAWLAVRATVAERGAQQERDRALAAQDDATTQRDRAVTAERDAKQQRDDALAQQQRADEQAAVALAINQFLVVDLLTQAEPEHNAPVDRVPLLVVLDRAADKVGERFRDQPLLEASLRGTLGDVYHGLGAFDKAERHWSTALALRRGVLGEDDLETLRAMSKLGHVLMHLRQYEQSAELLHPATTGLTRMIDADHPDTLYAKASLGYTYLNMGRHDEAISLCEETLANHKAALEANHFVTLNWLMDCLANAYLKAGRPEKALPQAEQALERTKAALGADHPRTLISIWTMADVYLAVDQFDKALPLYEQLLEKTKAKFGPDHTNTEKARWYLGVAYYAARQLKQSIPLFEEILRVRRAKLGENDPETINAALNLAVNYRADNRLDEAIALCELWLTRSRQKLGAEHPHTLYGLSELAGTYVEANEFDRAVPLYRELLNVQSRKLPADHPAWVNTLALLGRCLLDAGKITDAEPVLRECLTIRERKEPDAWTTFHTKSMLGGTLAAQKKYSDAEMLVLQGYEGLKQREAKIPANSKARLAEALERLVRLYDAWGKKDEAAKWRKELEVREQEEIQLQE
jgi:tetratricopeptide (TPR) repeat protein